MAPTAWWYVVLLLLVGGGRLAEMVVSRRRARLLAGRGVRQVGEPGFGWMVALHAGVLLAAALEVWLLRRPLWPALAVAAGLVFVAANLLRWWVIRTLGQHWNVRVMASTALGVVTSGPYRWVRHPNYVAVFGELLALPLIHGAWLTALGGALAHVLVLRRRLAVEDAVLLASAEYRAAMGHKPRFVPRLK